MYGATALPIPAPTYTVYGDVSRFTDDRRDLRLFSVRPAERRYVFDRLFGAGHYFATDGVTYNTAYLSYTPGVLTITPRPITVAAAASNRVYDGGISPRRLPPSPAGSLAYTDTPGFTETYDNKNVGTTHVMTPAGMVNDGNSGKNYAVTFAAISTGVINPALASVTPNPASKTYGTAAPTLTGTLAGFVGADGITAVYSRIAGESVAGNPYTISATLSPTAALGNYTLTYGTANFTINRGLLQ